MGEKREAAHLVDDEVDVVFLGDLAKALEECRGSMTVTTFGSVRN
jgi:hypothetical protein